MSTPPEWSPPDADPTAESTAPDAADGEVGPETAGDPGACAVPAAGLDAAYRRLRVERRILGDEQSAFRSFCDRLTGLGDGTRTEAIRGHYRATVVAVPHYWTEYGDDLEASLTAEFGPGLARDLERQAAVDAPTVVSVRRAAERCLEARATLVDRIDAERHAVETAGEALAELRTDLLALDDAGEHGDRRLRLAALRERCDEIARRRREQLDAVTETAGGEALPPGRLQSLCYRELAVDRPVLARVEAFRAAIEARRRGALERGSDGE